MKLAYCKLCGDLVRLTYAKRTCMCGSTEGRYFDSVNAEILGEYSVAIGFENLSFKLALDNVPESGMGVHFTAFVIPENVPSILRK